MRILYVDHTTELGGAEHSLLALLRTLDRDRFEPTLACPPGRLAERAQGLDVSVVGLDLEKLRSRNPLASLSRLRRGGRRLGAMLRERGFGVVHANTLRAAAYIAQVSRRSRPPFVWHVRDYEMPGVVRKALLRSCDAALVTSQFLAASLGNPEKARLVPNGVALADVPPDEAGAAVRDELGIAPSAPVIGCLGRIRPWKGQGYFVQAVAELAPRLSDAVFLLVGSTLFPDRGRDYVAELHDDAVRLGVADRIRFVPQRDDPLAVLRAMDVVVNCSENEPFGRVLIEAMACRRPVVAFRSGAVPEIVVDGSTGLLVPMGDTSGMAQAVLDLVRHPTRAEALGEAGRERVAEHFSLAASTRAIEALYGELA